MECPAHDGLHIFEDAFVVQIVDPETGEPLPDGELGSLCITELYKTGSPQFRYNIMDLSYLYPREQCACGSWLRKIGPVRRPRRQHGEAARRQRVARGGRRASPCAVDGVDRRLLRARGARRQPRRAGRVGRRRRAAPAEYAAIAAEIERLLKQRSASRSRVDVVAPGELDALTEIDTSPKSKRFRDERQRARDGTLRHHRLPLQRLHPRPPAGLGRRHRRRRAYPSRCGGIPTDSFCRARRRWSSAWTSSASPRW